MATAPRTAAVLVIHGIGEQNPYETLDAFARGIADQMDVGAGKMEHLLRWRDGGGEAGGYAETSIRIPLAKPTERDAVSTLDVYEFYWASFVEGKIGLWQVLRWLVRTSLTPLHYWNRPDALVGARGVSRAGPLWIFVRELWRAVLLLLVGFGIVLAFAYAALKTEEIYSARAGILAAVRRIRDPYAIVAWLVCTFLAVMLAYGWFRLSFGPRRQLRVWWRRATLAAMALFAFTGLAALLASHQKPLSQLIAFASEIWAPGMSIPALLTIAFTFALRGFLVKFLGDVTIYVTADEKSPFARTREKILNEACQRVRALIDDGRYAAVYIAGHSLGSVIAYDLLNRLSREVRAHVNDTPATAPAVRQRFDKIKGLLTFGSPLDKVAYFFRTEVGENQAIRAQILSSMHGLRKPPSGRVDGQYRLRPYMVPEPPGLTWINVYGTLDPVGAQLDNYKVDRQFRLPYWNLVTAHTKYWDDPHFHALVVEWLGFSRAWKPASKDEGVASHLREWAKDLMRAKEIAT